MNPQETSERLHKIENVLHVQSNIFEMLDTSADEIISFSQFSKTQKTREKLFAVGQRIKNTINKLSVDNSYAGLNILRLLEQYSTMEEAKEYIQKSLEQFADFEKAVNEFENGVDKIEEMGSMVEVK